MKKAIYVLVVLLLLSLYSFSYAQGDRSAAPGNPGEPQAAASEPSTAEACPKCHGEMQPGFLFQNAFNGSWGTTLFGRKMTYDVQWFRDPTPKPGTIKPRWDGQEITAFRCARCGYLELYATKLSRDR